MDTKKFPVIDVSPLRKYNPWRDDYKELFIKDKSIIELSRQFAEAFMEWGFIYVKNHGIEKELIDNAFSLSGRFFQKSQEEKDSVTRLSNREPWGYVPPKAEVLDESGLFDLKECFDFIPNVERVNLLKKTMPEFLEMGNTFFNECLNLSTAFMYLLSLQLPVEDINFLHSNHQKIGTKFECPTLLRMLYYPGISSRTDIRENQLRCGEHSDYGTFTLLFQDAPGLQVVNPSGQYIDATPIPGTIVVNAGDLLEIWSSGKFKSTKHRVLLPEKLDEARQSIVFFCHPDSAANISCLDGSDKYPTENSLEYLLKMYSQTYG